MAWSTSLPDMFALFVRSGNTNTPDQITCKGTGCYLPKDLDVLTMTRHVRVNHVDKDMNDPKLREVLSQRMEGGNRGRRRRLGSG